jgi:exonuclease SbcC
MKDKISSLEKEKRVAEIDIKEKETLMKESKELELKLKDMPDQKSLQVKVDCLKKEIEDNMVLIQKKKDKGQLSEKIAEKKKVILELDEKIESLKLEIGKQNMRKKDISEKCLLLKPLKGKIDVLRKDIQTDSEALRKLELEIASINAGVSNAEKNISELRKEILEKEKFISDSEKLLGFNSWISETFIPLMDNIEKHKLHRIYFDFNDTFVEWFSMLMDDDGITARLDEDFTPVVEANGYELSLVNLSGGEKTAVALAYRLALNRMINSVISSINTKGLLILDEPTDGFSAQQLDKMRDVLDDIDVEQLMIVSHENKIESFVENVIRIAKIGSSSTIV